MIGQVLQNVHSCQKAGNNILGLKRFSLNINGVEDKGLMTFSFGKLFWKRNKPKNINQIYIMSLGSKKLSIFGLVLKILGSIKEEIFLCTKKRFFSSFSEW